MALDERTIKKKEVEAIDIPPSELAVEMHGKRMFPIHTMVEEIAPNSFTEEMVTQNFDKASGTEHTKPPIAKGFVKPNEVLGKIKP